MPSSSKGGSPFIEAPDGTITCLVCKEQFQAKNNGKKAMSKHLKDKTHKKLAKKAGRATTSGGGEEEEKPKKRASWTEQLANLTLNAFGKSKDKHKKDSKAVAAVVANKSGGSEHGGSMFASRLTNADLVALVPLVPVRLADDERRLLHLVEGALNISEYTDRVDVAGNMAGYNSCVVAARARMRATH
jgi:hypothetical protein